MKATDRIPDLRWPDHTIRIMLEQPGGIPFEAECDCGWAWERPSYDPWAETLAPEVSIHKREVLATEYPHPVQG